MDTTAMNPSNAPETNLPAVRESNLPIVSEEKLPAVVQKPELPIRAGLSPEDTGKALQLRHENRLALREPMLPEVEAIPIPETGYREPIRLNFDDEIEPGKRKMHTGASGRLVGRAMGAVVGAAAMAAHGKIHEVENENSAVKGAHKSEMIAETSVRSAARTYNRKRQQQRNKLRDEPLYSEKQKKTADKSTQTGGSESKTHGSKVSTPKADAKKKQQKTQIKREYQLAARSKAKGTTSTASKSAKKAVSSKADKVKELIKTFFKNNKGLFYALAGLGVLFILMMIGLGSCSSMVAGTSAPLFSTTYASTDEAIYAAENAYLAKEQALERQINGIERSYPGYDKYNYDLDDIEHDPYELISILSALHDGAFTLAEAQGTLDMLFDKQYILTIEEVVEVRYRTETRTGTIIYTDPDTGATVTEEYEYEVEVPYNYYILNVELENFNLSHVPIYIMSQEQLSMYALYMSCVGNRADLFPDSAYVDKYIDNPPAEYTVNAAYLSDLEFATLIEEAEKYLNYPYVWGGSNPDTSFDCSGFVSYVLTNSGLANTGRLGAQGLYNICTPVSSANAKPGDLIFFTGTYDTPGISHVGIYVGDGVMLHCGDPIQYTSINTSYWQSHFYSYGRVP